MTDTFKQRDDLEELSNEERAEYNARFCEHLGIPSNLGLLKYFYANNIEGRRTLILYATRGATDIIRGNRGITVDSLDQVNGEGFVNFTARAHDASGRYEMATGAAGTTDLKGEKLANAIMSAQTKALRRVTLQFVGGGLLDESEIPTYDTTIPNTASLAELSKPAKTAPAAAVKPNNDAGKDVTVSVPAIVAGSVNVPALPNQVVLSEPTFAEKQQALRDEATRQLNEKTKRMEDESTIPTSEVAEAIKRTRKPRKAVNTVSLGEDAAPKIEAPQSLEKQALPAPEPAKPAITVQIEQPVIDLPEKKVLPPPVEGAPNAEKLKEYRTRLGKYANDILPGGGMMPSAGIGGVTMKLRNFANLQLGLSDVMRATEEQWDELLTFLDEYTTNKGAGELVKYIDAAIGVK